MARIFTSGFELNSLTAAMEWDAAVGATISSATVRSGTYAGRISSLVSGTNQRFRYQFKSVGSNGPFYFRFYLRVATRPSAENRIFALSSSATTGTSVDAYVTLDNTGALRLYDDDGVIGSASSALSNDTWYRIEIRFDRSGGAGATLIDARIDGTQFAASTTSTVTSSIFHMYLGGNLNSEAQTTGDWFFDDVAINDNTGSFQTSYPGSGKIIHLRPSAAGDANTFATQTGGTAGSGNNFTRVNETTPDDATTLNGSNTLNEEDLFNCGDSGINSYDGPVVVHIGARFRNNTADATTAIKLEVEKTTSGTISQSSAIIPNSTTWRTNTTTAPMAYPIILYQDPDSSLWTQSTLDSMQIGYKITAGGTNRVEVSNVWACIEYAPGLPALSAVVNPGIQDISGPKIWG